jgi:hypothetical protein
MMDTTRDLQRDLWTQEEAIELCKIIEDICPRAGCHVALTGGCLYKDGERKDLDILFYSIRQTNGVEETKPQLLALLPSISQFKIVRDFGWCCKATYKGKSIDMFFPETPFGNSEDYPPCDDAVEIDEELHLPEYIA